MLGYESAKRVVLLGRSAFFPIHADLPLRRSSILSGDDMVPQFGFVGERYEGRRVLLMGINPGNGPRDDVRTPGDQRMMPAIHRFGREPTTENYAQASQAYRVECQQWPLWKRHCAEVIGAGRLLFDEIAYSNCLPWRTASKSDFDDGIARKAAELYARPLITELQPSVVVAMGKRAASILNIVGPTLKNLIVWNRAQAATTAVLRDRASTALRIFQAVKA